MDPAGLSRGGGRAGGRPGATLDRPATMLDVAHLAGVSHQTVSRVVNGSDLVTPARRERVLHAMGELDYRPNAAARSLITRRTMTIGVLSPTPGHGSRAILAVCAEARRAGYATSVVGVEDADPASLGAALGRLGRGTVDGVVVLAAVAGAAVADLAAATRVPLVVCAPTVADEAARVVVDEVLGARLATGHLADLGHDAVHHLAGPPGWTSSAARERGWAQELAARGAPAPAVVAGDWSAASGYRATRALLDSAPVTALFVANDRMALGALRAAADAGRRVPGDLAVVGFGGSPEAEYFEPALTTVELDAADAARHCVAHVLAAIDGAPPPARTVVVPRLVRRASTLTA